MYGQETKQSFNLLSSKQTKLSKTSDFQQTAKDKLQSFSELCWKLEVLYSWHEGSYNTARFWTPELQRTIHMKASNI